MQDAGTDGLSASLINRADTAVSLTARAELGLLSVVDHQLQFDRAGTRLDMRSDGGQDVLFPFARLEADASIEGRHTLMLLYQPLNIPGHVVSRRNLTIDGATFAAGRSLDVKYGFSFWRLSYAYEFFGRGETELGIGGGLQIRNASIDFTDAQAGQRRSQRDVGPVPLIKVRGRIPLGESLWGAAEMDGIWAPVKYFNGSKTDVNGALLDASVRLGTPLVRAASAFINLRYLGGGAEGQSRDARDFGDGYTRNWLHFVVLSLGAELR